MSPEQLSLARNLFQQALDIAVARTMWSLGPVAAALVGAVAFAILWWLVG